MLPHPLASLAAALLFAGAARAQSSNAFNITAQFTYDGMTYLMRTWYGDGQMYVGSTVPDGIINAFNFTVPNESTDNILYIEPLAPASIDPLPSPTFLALSNAPGAGRPLFFASNTSELAATDVMFWLHYELILFPDLDDEPPLTIHYFLEETATEGTYLVTWESAVPVRRAAGTNETREAARKEKKRRRREASLDGVGLILLLDTGHLHA
ncbi:hypothetical protein F4778DRAFT_788678 [Xylariomycetidae sp. FL2044]|nr:hypothetical protein F4778DRAFT_788675 [Xylariomycetidae sp. FL2044]KAH9883361.1 hypothetical protein F4778DRAFT_788678 [Xylariomycetidae sp. FL2044]